MSETSRFQLVVRRGPQPNQTFDLNKDIVTIGRDITNDIVINDPEVSRHHLRFTRGADGFNIEDLGSTNGTFINGQRITGVRPLNPGEMIGLGETVTLGYERVRPAGESPAQMPTMQSNPSPEPHDDRQYAPPAAADPPQYEPPASQPQYAPPPQQQPGQGYYQAPQQQPPPPQSAYGQAQPGYDQQPQDYNYSGGPPPGYDYDPYAMREEDPRSATRWILLGCGIISVFCCCSSVVGLVVIDALSLWYDIPIIRDLAPLFENIAQSLGMI